MLSRHKAPVGVEARKALVLFKQHLQREEEFILPPLTLLHAACRRQGFAGYEMGDRHGGPGLKASEKTYQEHTQITDAMNALAAAATQKSAMRRHRIAPRRPLPDSLNDLELLEPMSIVIGDYLEGQVAGRQ